MLFCFFKNSNAPYEKRLRVLEIDDDMTVLLLGEDGLCINARFLAPSSVIPKDVREAIKHDRYVEAHLIGHTDNCLGVIYSICIHA